MRRGDTLFEPPAGVGRGRRRSGDAAHPSAGDAATEPKRNDNTERADAAAAA